MATYYVSKMITTCSLMIGQVFDIMIVTSTDKEWNNHKVPVTAFSGISGKRGNCAMYTKISNFSRGHSGSLFGN